MTTSQADRVRSVLDDQGRTFAEEAGITLRDRPKPFSSSSCSACSPRPGSRPTPRPPPRELWSVGWRTPHRMLDSTWQERVDALGRGGYRRYDESTASRLADMAERVIDEYGGDLRALRPDRAEIEDLRDGVTAFTGIGLAVDFLPGGSGRLARGPALLRPEVARGSPVLGPPGRSGAAGLAGAGRSGGRAAAALVRVA